MRFLLPIILMLIIAASCDPTVSIPIDPRNALIGGTRWNFISLDTLYLNNGTPVYLVRTPKDTCSELLIFNPDQSLIRRDSCGTGAAGVLNATWIWRKNDSLLLQYGGQVGSDRSVRYTGDTLQLTGVNEFPKGFDGHVVLQVRTYIKLM